MAKILNIVETWLNEVAPEARLERTGKQAVTSPQDPKDLSGLELIDFYTQDWPEDRDTSPWFTKYQDQDEELENQDEKS